MALHAQHTPRRRPQNPHLQHAQHVRSPLHSALSNLSGLAGGTPAGSGGGQPADSSAVPWESDPVLQQIRSLQAANIASADAQAQASRQQALINFGYSNALDGLYGDQGTKGSAQSNPFSVLAQLLHGHELQQRGLNDSYNKANLFYSSARAAGLGEEGQHYLGQQQEAADRLRGGLNDLENARLAAHSQANDAITQGMTDAQQRYLDQQIQYGLGGTGGGGHHGNPMRVQHRPSGVRQAVARARRGVHHV